MPAVREAFGAAVGAGWTCGRRGEGGRGRGGGGGGGGGAAASKLRRSRSFARRGRRADLRRIRRSQATPVMTAVRCTLTATLACAAQACCRSTCRTSGRSAPSTPSMRPRGRSRRRSMATRRPAPTATASRATRPCPRAATGGAATRRRTAMRIVAALCGARSASMRSGSARGRCGQRRRRSTHSLRSLLDLD